MSHPAANNRPLSDQSEGPCPYRDLLPFEESDTSYFFGRSDEIRLIADNLRASRLTILYGPSGSGKTSLLRAGVAARLRDQARPEQGQSGSAEFLTVYFKLWQRDPVRELANEIEDSLQVTCGPADAPFEPADSLAQMVPGWRQRYRFDGDFLIILDQFEDFFKYARRDQANGGFAAELPRLLRGDRLFVNVLIAIRDDSLALLDHFKAHIPNLLNNRLLLPHLSRQAAISAMTEPLRVFREQYGEGSGTVSLDPVLAGEVADEITGAQQKLSPSDEHLVQAPYLQLVMTRWWRAEKAKSSLVLNGDTLRTELGGVRHIAETHFADSVGRLPPEQRETAAEAFESMVTPGGRKIAQTVSELAGKGLKPELVGAMLATLQQDRIVVAVPPPKGFPDEDRCYEFSHDVIAQAALEWYKGERKDRLTRARERRKRIFIGTAIFFLLIVVAGFVWRAQSDIRQLKLSQEASEAVRAGDAQVLKGDYGVALSSYQNALGLSEELSDKPRQLIALLDLGRVSVLKKDYEQAGRLYQRSYELSRRLGASDAEAQVLEQRASLQEQLGKLPEALRIYGDAQRAYQRAGDHEGSARVLERLATNAEESRDINQADLYYQEALKSYTAADHRLGISRVQSALDRLRGWGFLVDLHEPRIHRLIDASIDIGRDVPEAGIRNTINLPNILISRHHLFIYQSKVVEDLRSTNGTTINGVVLPYARTAHLHDGDIIVAAGVHAFQFQDSKPEKTPSPPPRVWGLLVDGATRSFQYLTNTSYSLNFTEERLSLEPRQNPSALFLIRLSKGDIQVFYKEDEWSILVSFVNKGEYEAFILKSGSWLPAAGIAMEFIQLSSDKKTVVRRGPDFQIVPFGG
jgi:tetratricopeptide (TPR) repeat protein